MLCSNRPEGFGPHSSLSSPIPTTCFTDVILMPLPVWFSLALLPLLFALSLQHRKANFDPSTAHLRSKPNHNCAFNSVSIIYYILIICNILMEVLELVRISLLEFGIGLLPFVIVGMMLAGYLHWSEGVQGRIRGWQTVNGVVWIGGIVMCAIKVVGLTREGIHGRKGSKYPIADQVTDVAVMAGVYAIIAVLELVLGFWRALRRTAGNGTGVNGGRSPGSGMSPVVDQEDWNTGMYERKGTL